MFFQEADLFKGMSQELVKEIDEITSEESYDMGVSLFTEGQPANNFYILVAGKVKLTIGEQGYLTHVVSNPGEAFGWSSLVEHGFYTASAKCTEMTKLRRIEKEKLDEIFVGHPDSGVLFYKRLAGIVGRRLINSYHSLLTFQTGESAVSHGISEDFDTEARIKSA